MGVRKALGISAASQAIQFVLGFASVVIVSRLLKPEEIGVFSVAVSVLGFAHIFREFGVGRYLVQAAEVGRTEFRAAFTVTLICSWTIALALFLLRYPLSVFYGHAGIAEVLGLICINFLIMPLGTPLLSMLRRDLEFGRLATATIVSVVMQTAVTIACAYQGQSYLSMAWGSIAAHLSKAILLNYFRPGWTLVLPTRRGLREVLKFGSISSAASLIREFGNAAPDLVLGRTLGFAEVAVFSRGVGMQKMIVTRIDALVRSVYFPTFAQKLRKGGDGAQLYGQATDYLVAVTLPLLAVLAVLAEPLIIGVFGPQWQPSVEIAVCICLGCMLVAPYSLAGLSLTAAGKVQSELRIEWISQLAKVLVLLSSIWLSLGEVARLLVLAYGIEACVFQQSLRRAFGLGFRGLARQLWKAVALIGFAVLGPALILFAAKSLGYADSHRFTLLGVASLLALLGWLLGVQLLDHPWRAEIARMTARLRR